MARVLHSGDTSWEECPGRGGRGRFLHFLFSLFISSDHVARLDPETFYFQFHNLLYAYGRNCSYICYRVKTWKHCSPVSFDWGVFHNQVRAPGNSSHLFGALELQCGQHRFKCRRHCVPPREEKPGSRDWMGKLSKFQDPCTSRFPKVVTGGYNHNCHSFVLRLCYVRY